ncbi:hypothetical protein GJ689_09675 [Rhodoplanes serenus]|uniref:C4-dicarboxylate ABC transporter substrate-binding protein n=1 Tax=Rhodoplanes serenus TaxID=200615 RepID=A0A9X4XQ67_9BRAD|nr:TRAP transporter substrate-binding protein DctP [Rhodoplanes serenus]MTW16481.1 hypothetical protein [Rhodoplanes serenus]
MTKTTTIAALLAATLVAGPGAAQSQTTLRLSEPAGPGSPEAAALAEFKAAVERRSAGRLRIVLRLGDGPAGATGPALPVEGLKAGTIDLYTGPLDAIRHVAPRELGALSLPWLMVSADQLRAYLAGPVFRRAEDALLQRHGVRFVSTAFTGVRTNDRIVASTRPLRSAADLIGLRIRVRPDDLADRSWRSLGAQPVALGWNETYLALRRGLVEATVLPLGEVPTAHFAAVAPHVAVVGTAPRLWPMLIAERAWQMLGPDDRALLAEAADSAGRTYARITAEAARHDLAEMTARHGVVMSWIEVAPLRHRLAPLWRDLVVRGLLADEAFATVTAHTIGAPVAVPVAVPGRQSMRRSSTIDGDRLAFR